MTTPLFSQFLAEHNYGIEDQLFGRKLGELAQACMATEKKGTFTMKVSVDPKAGGFSVEMLGEAKEPQAPEATYYFLHPTGLLSKRHPDQPEIPFHQEDPSND